MRLKVKCDKQLPCSRCTRTGHVCVAREPLSTRRRTSHMQNTTAPSDHGTHGTSDTMVQPPILALGQARRRLPASVWALVDDIVLGQQLVNFHIKYLTWYHNVLHSPTFLDECETFWTEKDTNQPLWVALYLAILSTSAWTLENAPQFSHSLGIDSSELAGLASMYYSAMLDTMYAADFMTNHSIHSIQAVVISIMVAHCLGRSDQLYTLLFSCTRIAQCLGLHRIETRKTTTDMSFDQWTATVNQEVGRRVYWKLVESDYYAIPYTNTYGTYLTTIARLIVHRLTSDQQG